MVTLFIYKPWESDESKAQYYKRNTQYDKTITKSQAAKLWERMQKQDYLTAHPSHEMKEAVKYLMDKVASFKNAWW